jgi:hypothetical protein
MSGTGSVEGEAQVIEAGAAAIQGQGAVTADSAVIPGPVVSDPKFLAAFPEFNDAGRYPAPQRQMWLTIATNNLDPYRWGDYYELGVYLFIAHHLAVFANQRGKSGMAGRIPFPMGSKSVGSVSASYDTSILSQMADKGGGLWGLTTYGMEWYRLSQMVGMGGVQIGYGPLPPFSGPGFSGPDMGDWPYGGGF